MLPRRHLLALLLALTACALPAHAAEPAKILFIDTGNTGRSLMAETLARGIAAKAHLPIAVISRGLDVDPFDEAPEPNARVLMAARGYDIAAYRARALTAGDVAHADVILTMTPAHADKVVGLYPEARAKVFALAVYATGAAEPVPDAWGKPMAVYRAVVAQLDRMLPPALAKAAALAKP